MRNHLKLQFFNISEFISYHKSILICLGKRYRLLKTAKPFTLVYMLTVGALLMMGTDFNTRDNQSYSIHGSIPIHMYTNPLSYNNHVFHITPIYQPLLKEHSVVQKHAVPSPIPPIVHKNPITIELTTAQYEVTSYYLNVRENKNVDSEVLNVVENGDVLEVLEVTDNNWLKLKSGGYVHGHYAKLVSDGPERSSRLEDVAEQGKPNKPSTSVHSDSKLTEEQIEHIFEGTSLADHGLEQSILQAEDDYGINAYFTIAVMKLESGHGKSKLAKEKNNLFGLNAIDGDAYNKAFSFKTKSESVEKFGQIISKHYIDKGYTSVEKVATKYCQANPKWSKLVMKIMKNDYKKIQVSMK